MVPPLCTTMCDNLTCEQPAAVLGRCSSCKSVSYCGLACQRASWKAHKPDCHAMVQKPTVAVQQSTVSSKNQAADAVRQSTAPSNNQATDYAGSGNVQIGGESFDVQEVIDMMFNSDDATSAAFSKLESESAKADVLAGRATLNTEAERDPSLPEGCPSRSYIGSGGSKCDGCNQSLKKIKRDCEEDDDFELGCCDRCKYACCEDCEVHHSRGTCYCRDSNFGWTYPPRDSPDSAWYHTGNW